MWRLRLTLILSLLAACAEDEATVYVARRPDAGEPDVEPPNEDCLIGTDCDPRLVAHYSFDGDARDLSQNELDGTVEGPVPIEDHDRAADGALSFDGVDDYVEVDTDVIGFRGPFSFALWIRFHTVSVDGRKRIFGKGTAPSSAMPNWSLNLDADRRISFFWEAEDDFDHYTFSQTLMEADRYVHIAGVVDTDDDQSRLFIDGVLDATLENEAVIPLEPPFVDPFYVGARLNVDVLERFIGADIADIRLYHAALDDDEVRALYELR